MALREVKPLSPKQWDFVVKTIKKKATPEQRNMMKRAIKEGSQIKTIR